MGGKAECLCYALLWCLLLVFLSWPIALVLVFLWIFLLPFETVFHCMRSLTRCLERFITWPRDCGHAIINGSRKCPRP